MNILMTCPECGASPVDGLNCWEQLGMVISWEGQDPELAAEHFLTVASYNLQHPAQFTEEALAGLRASFIERVDRGACRPGDTPPGSAGVRREEARPQARWRAAVHPAGVEHNHRGRVHTGQAGGGHREDACVGREHTAGDVERRGGTDWAQPGFYAPSASTMRSCGERSRAWARATRVS
jgi:hypothetical protein